MRAIIVSSIFTTRSLLRAASAMSTFVKPEITHHSTYTTISPKNPSALLIIMHGLGDTAAGFTDVAQMWSNTMPHIKFILPTAPSQPVSMNMNMAMPSWYDIKGLDERTNEECDGIFASQTRINKILDEENLLGIPFSRMAVGGFSQGGAMSLFVGLQMPVEKKLAGVCVMSGYLAGSKQFKLTPGLENTPVFHGHGTQDPMVAFSMAEKTKKMLEEAGVTNYEMKSYPIQHTVIPEEIQDVGRFLAKILPGGTENELEKKAPSEMSVKELKAAIKAGGLGNQAVGLCEKSEFVKLLNDNL